MIDHVWVTELLHQRRRKFMYRLLPQGGYRIVLPILIGLLFWIAMLPGVVSAEDKTTDRVVLTTESGDAKPPLPSIRPRMAVPASLARESAASAAALIPVAGRMPAPDPESSPAVQAARDSGEKWIRVALSEQKVYAYEGADLVNSFIVSTGLPRTPTVTGEFRMWTRTPIQNMSGGSRASGDYYFLRDVQWVQYFYGNYGFHGTYWHSNYGNPMSRGCVNMTNEDAKWLFDWAFPQWNGQRGWFPPTNENATLVVVHP
jgi:lipoprotein-anchoring transpeptidase ErfK/SrfK